MAIYGTALLAIRLLLGMVVGELLGDLVASMPLSAASALRCCC